MVSEKVGAWAFIIGVVIAVIAGLASAAAAAYAGYITLALVILGLIIGFLNISEKQVTGFLVAAIALILVGTVAGLTTIDVVVPGLGTMLQAIVSNIAALVAPAALVVALKAVYNLASKLG